MFIIMYIIWTHRSIGILWGGRDEGSGEVSAHVDLDDTCPPLRTIRDGPEGEKVHGSFALRVQDDSAWG